jgi:predicted alpha/beta superfamily hydrolase
MRRMAMLLLLLPLPRAGSAQARFERVTHIGVVDSVWSATLQENRPYLVHTPRSYADTTFAPRRYPVLYLLDGDAHFQSVTGLIQILGTGVNGTYVVPEMIVVAIPNTDRTRDLTPTHSGVGADGRPQPAFETSGGGSAFLTFLRTELIPRIDSLYRTMPYRVFVGHSFGGITTLEALYTIPETFDAYVAIDPSLWWDDQVLLKRARGYFGSARLDGKALYVAQANTVDPADTTVDLHFASIAKFDAVMRAYDRSGLRYGFRYYPEDDHGSVPLIAEYDALRFIFDGYAAPLRQALDRPSLLTEHFRDVSTRLGATFQPPEQMLRLMGQAALTQDTAKAIEFGEMRVRLYPESFRAYEFLGDVWAGKGDIERARGYYEQALERSGGNPGLREKIAKLGG